MFTTYRLMNVDLLFLPEKKDNSKYFLSLHKMLVFCLKGHKMKFNPLEGEVVMKSYFFLIPFCFLIHGSATLAGVNGAPPNSPDTYLTYYPAIKISKKLSEAIFLDTTRSVLNCPLLFDNSWDYPNGSSIALCDDAQLACLRYGLLQEKRKVATGRLLEELNKTLVLEKQEVGLRLRACQLVLEATTIDQKTLEEAAGYPLDAYGSAAQ